MKRKPQGKTFTKNTEQFSVQSLKFKVGNNLQLETRNSEQTEDKAGAWKKEVQFLDYLHLTAVKG